MSGQVNGSQNVGRDVVRGDVSCRERSQEGYQGGMAVVRKFFPNPDLECSLNDSLRTARLFEGKLDDRSFGS